MSLEDARVPRPVTHQPHIRPVGDRALLVEVDALTDALAWHRTLTATPLPGQIEAVAAARTVLVRFATDTAAEAARASLPALAPSAQEDGTARRHTLDVVYDGEDLDSTARLLGLSVDALIDQHTRTEWTAAFGGFAPGFAYCVPASGVELWDVPRLDEPRTAVPPGSVGLAGGFSAAYPRRSPGGWRLIGRTDALLWSTDRTPPALLTPGDLITYRRVRDTARAAEQVPEGAQNDSSASDVPELREVFVVEDPGMLTLIQDGGRPGWGDVGVSPSGFADAASAEAANRCVGNEPGAALLEVAGSARFTCLADVVVGIAGAAGGVTVAPRLLRAGKTLDLTGAPDLARTYVAVRSGLVAASELGSASTDVLSGLGPAPVGAGDHLSVPLAGAAGSVGHPEANPARLLRDRAAADGCVTLRVVPGPREDWFSEAEQNRFRSVEWIVGPQSNRVGLRLQAPDGEAPLSREHAGELPSEGTVTGTVQVPAHGLPVVFGRDRPVTGGYPAITTVVEADLDLLGQLVPGDRVRFRDASH
jgi:KipI family sensor histidine kinase inhibitor